jgi:hypothetical protein
MNAGGDPAGGAAPASASFEITLDAIGDSVLHPGLTSASFRMDGGFVSGYLPPGEVLDLRFGDTQTLVWSPERAAEDYNLYRGLMSDLVGPGYGSCVQQHIPQPTTTDGDPIAPGDGFFYLATAENRVDEEGTKGHDSNGIERLGNVCP